MVGELYAATAGIGFMITVAGATFQTDKVFVGVLIFAIIGMVSMLMGLGGGTLGVPVFTLLGVPIHRAVGTAAGLGLFIAIPGTLGWLWAGLGVPGRPPLSLGYVNAVGLALIVPATMLAAPWV